MLFRSFVLQKTNDVTAEALIPPEFEHDGQTYVTDIEEATLFMDDGPPPMYWGVEKIPFPGGYSISLKKETAAGTFGCLVQLKPEPGETGGKVCLLTNNHVIGRGGLAKPGTDKVVAPGILDATSVPPIPAIEIGVLIKFQPLDFQGGVNTVDAAVARSEERRVGKECRL